MQKTYITNEECELAIAKMKSNKSPGSDGITIEFYKCFWKDVQNLVIESLNEGFDSGKLSDSQKHGIITLSYKKGDKNNLNNWRPITLLLKCRL